MGTMEIAIDEDTVLEIEREQIEYRSELPQSDPTWRGTDSHGHEHAYHDGTDRYPTLKVVYGEPYWCSDCQDEHQDSWYECRQCGETVGPGTRTDTSPKFMNGATEYRLNGEPIDKEHADQILADAQRAADEAARITSRPTIGTRVRLGDVKVTVVPTDTPAPDDQVTVMFDGTGAMETVPLEQLRKAQP